MTSPLLLNDSPMAPTAEERRRYEAHRAARSQPAPPRPRQFDHLDWHPPLALDVQADLAAQDRRFSRAAHAMHASTWWFAWAPAVVRRSADGWTWLARHDDGRTEVVQREEPSSNNPPPVSGEIVTGLARALEGMAERRRSRAAQRNAP